jgi:hypothetical protein
MEAYLYTSWRSESLTDVVKSDVKSDDVLNSDNCFNGNDFNGDNMFDCDTEQRLQNVSKLG